MIEDNEYLDWMMGLRTMTLGYGQERVIELRRSDSQGLKLRSSLADREWRQPAT